MCVCHFRIVCVCVMGPEHTHTPALHNYHSNKLICYLINSPQINITNQGNQKKEERERESEKKSKNTTPKLNIAGGAMKYLKLA